MRTWVLLIPASLGFAACGVATFLGVSNYEPPHPHYAERLSAAKAYPDQFVLRYEVRDSKTHAVSIYPSAPACTLTVLDAAGRTLASDKSQGGLCMVTLAGTPGDEWRVHATGAPEAEVQVAIDNPVFPKPLGHIAVVGSALGLVSVAAMVLLGLFTRRSQRKAA